MPIIDLPNGFSIRTYEPAPLDFDPLIAPDNLLLEHGLPPRPDPQTSPALQRWWELAVSRKLNYIVPTFQTVEGKTHGPQHKSESGVADTRPNWSGNVVLVPDTEHSFLHIEGRWTVPNPYRSSSDESGGIGDQASEWIGIGGSGPGVILQAGTETDFSSNKHVSYPWWEWYPDNYETTITNFPVTPGDVMWCLLYVFSPNSGQIHLGNISGRHYTSFTVNSHPAIKLTGNSAEWIVERPTVNGTLPSLANYGMVYFDEGRALYTQGSPGSTQNRTPINLGSGTLITMIGNDNVSLSIPTRVAPRNMEVNWLASH